MNLTDLGYVSVLLISSTTTCQHYSDDDAELELPPIFDSLVTEISDSEKNTEVKYFESFVRSAENLLEHVQEQLEKNVDIQDLESEVYHNTSQYLIRQALLFRQESCADKTRVVKEPTWYQYLADLTRNWLEASESLFKDSGYTLENIDIGETIDKTMEILQFCLDTIKSSPVGFYLQWDKARLPNGASLSRMNQAVAARLMAMGLGKALRYILTVVESDKIMGLEETCANPDGHFGFFEFGPVEGPSEEATMSRSQPKRTESAVSIWESL